MRINLYVIIGVFILPLFTYAQRDVNIGLHVNYITARNSRLNSDYLPSNNSEVDTRNSHSYSGDFLFEIDDTDKKLYRLRIGYGRIFSNSSSSVLLSNGEFREMVSEYGYKEYRFGIGIGKIYRFGKFVFRLGVEVPMHIFQPLLNTSVQENFDSLGEQTGSNKIYYTRPNYYSFGIGFYSRAYYNIWNSVDIGMEIGNMLYYTIDIGSYQVKFESYNSNGVLTDSNTIDESLNYKEFGTAFLIPSLGISYQF